MVTPADVYVRGCAVKLPRWQGWARGAREKLEATLAGAHLPTSAAVRTAEAVA